MLICDINNNIIISHLYFLGVYKESYENIELYIDVSL